jgi:hypothetical protein
MGRGETTQNTKRRRISTKYRKKYRLEFRYDDFIKQCFTKYMIEHGLDVETTKTTKVLDAIVREWFENETIKEFQREDPDLMIKMKNQENKQLWIDYIYEHCNKGEIYALRSACDSILEYGKRVVSKITLIKIKNK